MFYSKSCIFEAFSWKVALGDKPNKYFVVFQKWLLKKKKKIVQKINFLKSVLENFEWNKNISFFLLFSKETERFFWLSCLLSDIHACTSKFMFEHSQGDFPIKTPWKPSKIRAVVFGRFVGWQIPLMRSELEKEVLQQGSKTHCRYLERLQQRQVIHLFLGMPTPLPASFHQQCPFKPIWKNKMPWTCAGR